MPRSGGTYSLPAGSIVVNGTTIDASQHNTPLNDIASDLNAARPISSGGTGATTAAGALTNFGLTATAAQINRSVELPGRNLIINGQGRINQRGYTSGAATSGANQFTLDRWFVVTSGQNLSFTGNDSRRVMTAPAGGVRQVVKSENVIGGDYVLNWDGTATATVNGTTRTKGEVFTLTANTNVVVAFASGTFTDVQLEAGTLATPFEWRPQGLELALCQRYFCVKVGVEYLTYTGAGNGFRVHVSFPVEMASNPTISLSSVTFVNASGATTSGISSTGFSLGAAATALGPAALTATVSASAELTS